MNFQRTIKKPVTLKGIGLHLGKEAAITLKPAGVNQGILFQRVDLADSLPIEANFRNVVNTQMATTLGKGNVTVSTIEHLMAALHGFGIDNVLVEVVGPEVPILDGSSVPFCTALKTAGVQNQSAPRTALAIKRRVEVKLAEKWAVVEPSSRLEVHASIDWDHPSIGFQEFHYVEGKTSFEEISAARTFGFLRDVEALKKMGLILGGSLENAVVLDSALVLNPEGLRYPDEFVRHKALDALGDFKLAGIQIVGSFKLHRAGHDLHRSILAEVFKDPANYEIIETATDAGAEAPAASKIAVAARFAV
ncbi:MAG: UDP-3-O-acyl-N-acetylglucosamine deacetylase [Bdellovibrionales bacterium]|nr:UDP-3-O-acyl-N-acetylglucosamine deacetylase [Bdellovibrionales bacterium]